MEDVTGPAVTAHCATRGPTDQTVPLAVTRTVTEAVTRQAVAAHAASREFLALMFAMGFVQPSVPVIPVNVLLETVMDAKEGSLEVNVPAMPTVKEGVTVLTETVQ
ncbi:uncharacterized protein, partial [Littorina saxatilis]|uniref:uncharacterized protein n=1 Tax=Littorina saxatilis TaxID=31220 RepID=UPI0038B5B585